MFNFNPIDPTKMYDLVSNVTVHAPDFFGSASQLVLYPNAQKDYPHWTVRHVRSVTTRIVTPKMLRHSRRTVKLVGGSVCIPIVEHILPLAWLVAGVHILQVMDHPPYIMPGEMLKPDKPNTHHSILNQLQRSRSPRDWEPIKKGARWDYAEKRGGETAYVSAFPIDRETLEVFVVIDYPGIGRFEKLYDLEAMGEAELIRILCTPPQAVVPCSGLLKPFLRMLWPHYNNVVWPDVSSREARLRTLEAWADHRFLDILGTFGSLVDGYDFPAMRIESYCAGHKGDVEVVQRLVTARPLSDTQRIA